jgi:hypothetical protein
MMDMTQMAQPITEAEASQVCVNTIGTLSGHPEYHSGLGSLRQPPARWDKEPPLA